MTTKLGSEIAVGDVLEFLGKPYGITSFSDHRPFLGATRARSAYSGTWGITIADNDRFTRCETHGWYAQNSCLPCYQSRA